MALNPIIKFTTLFGVLAVDLAVSVAKDQGVGIHDFYRRGIPGDFDVLRLPFVLPNENPTRGIVH